MFRVSPTLMQYKPSAYNIWASSSIAWCPASALPSLSLYYHHLAALPITFSCSIRTRATALPLATSPIAPKAKKEHFSWNTPSCSTARLGLLGSPDSKEKGYTADQSCYGKDSLLLFCLLSNKHMVFFLSLVLSSLVAFVLQILRNSGHPSEISNTRTVPVNDQTNEDIFRYLDNLLFPSKLPLCLQLWSP